AVSLPARDSVIHQFDIHTSRSPSLISFSIIADSTLPWMQQLGMGNIPTGTPEVDSLLIPYGLMVNSYFRRFGSEVNHWVFFKSDSFYNTRALAKAFEKIQGVSHTEPEFAIGDGNYIIDSIYNDHVELIYSLGWGDCPAGCINRRFWKFNVYNDCSVEYMGSYGDLIDITGMEAIEMLEPLVYPNPFSDELRFEKIDGPFVYTLIDEQGRIIMKGSTDDKKTSKLNTLLGGLYYLRIETRNGIYTTKVIKLSR
ncbi:MAG: T9SS type A sorting domain-containing protein, partial [Bacteroidia bacterium]